MNKYGDLLRSRVDSPVRVAAQDARAARAASAPTAPRTNETAIIYGAVAAAIIIAMSPALFFSFGYNNDFNAWAYDSCCAPQPETYFLIALGRYFGGYAEDLQFWTIHTLGDLWRWRLVGILSTALLAVYYLNIVSLRRPPTWQNACLSVAVFTLPTMQFQAMWVSMYAFWTPPLLLSLVSARLLLKATERDVFADHSAIRRGAQFALLAFAALLAACFFYPMSATFVVVPAAHLLLSENKRQFRRMAVLAAALLGAAVVALFVIHKFIVMPHLSSVGYLGDYAFVFSENLLGDAFRRLTQYIGDASFLWLAFRVPHFRELVALLCIVGAGFGAIGILRRSIRKTELLNVLMACLLFGVAAAPLLVVQHDTASYRVMFAMTGIVLLVVFWLLKQLPLGSFRLAALFAAFGVGCAFIGVYGTSASAHAEQALLAKAVANLSPRESHSITVLQPDRSMQVLGFPLDKEFGTLHPIEYIFDSLIGTRYNEKASFEVITLVLPPDSERNGNELHPAIERDSVVIDTSAIYGLPDFKDITTRLPVVSAQPPDLRHGVKWGPANAVDNDPDSFWEAAGVPFPIELEIDYPTAHTLRGYSLSTIEATERMPSSWEIWTSSDHVHWRRLQEMTEGQPWKTAESRHYDVKRTPDVTGLKLVINGTDDKSILRLYEFRPEFEDRPQ